MIHLQTGLRYKAGKTWSNETCNCLCLGGPRGTKNCNCRGTKPTLQSNILQIASTKLPQINLIS